MGLAALRCAPKPLAPVLAPVRERLMRTTFACHLLRPRPCECYPPRWCHPLVPFARREHCCANAGQVPGWRAPCTPCASGWRRATWSSCSQSAMPPRRAASRTLAADGERREPRDNSLGGLRAAHVSIRHRSSGGGTDGWTDGLGGRLGTGRGRDLLSKGGQDGS